MDSKIKILSIIEEYEKKIAQIETESKEIISKYKNLIEALKLLPEYATETSIEKMFYAEPVSNIGIPKTLNQKVKDALKNMNRPLTSREIMGKVNLLYLTNRYKFKVWSGIFSQMYSKPNSGIKKFIFENQPVNLSTFYGLAEWFETNGELKSEYLNRLKETHGI